ncbi:hypothetical protein CVT24_002873 [Panaeolus cyanescens]|uniref:DUF302 domain-containing protein n=1 Tax=Panaeolus cyanescens TaxID=181874 RepID=A0A409YRK7_9AGAR|nr:hypothetical protein CVT24_002873 [Panaeolus cyanescens]
MASTTNPNVKKSLITLPAPHFVVFETPLPTATVLAHLDKELHRDEVHGIIDTVTKELKSQEEFEAKIGSITNGGGDIIYMNSIPMHSLTTLRTGNPSPPLIVHYMLGNPLYAQRIIKLNPLAGASIPPRLVVAENEDKSGTRIAYNLPSAVMRHPFGEEDEELRKELEVLDERFEDLVMRVIDSAAASAA